MYVDIKQIKEHHKE